MFCTKCGKKSFEEARFCSECGTRIGINQAVILNQIPTDRIGENSIYTLTCMVGTEAPHYIPIFKEIERSRKAPGTALGLIWPFWMLYRKMYKEFFLCLLILIITFWVPGVRLGIVIYMCFNLNKMYYHSILCKLRKCQLTGVNIQNHLEYQHHVKRAGGTSFLGIIIYSVALLLLVIGVAEAVISSDSEYESNEKTSKVFADQRQSETDKTIYRTKEEEFEFSFEKDWEQIYENKQAHLQCYSEEKDMAIIVFANNSEDLPEGWDTEDILNSQIEDLRGKREVFNLVDDQTVRIEKGIRFTSTRYEEIANDGNFYYYFTLIECPAEDNRYAMVIQVVNTQDWEKYKDELEQIILSVEYRNKVHRI